MDYDPAVHDPAVLVVDAILSMLYRNGNVWGQDEDRYLRRCLTEAVNAAMDLGSDGGPDVWRAAETTLRTMRDRLNAD